MNDPVADAERKRELELESAIADASLMANLTLEFIGRALRFDQLQPPTLNEEDCSHLSFAVLQTRVMIDRAKAIFYREDAK